MGKTYSYMEHCLLDKIWYPVELTVCSNTENNIFSDIFVETQPKFQLFAEHKANTVAITHMMVSIFQLLFSGQKRFCIYNVYGHEKKTTYIQKKQMIINL